MSVIWTMGEALVEIMRLRPGVSMETAEVFMGPYPSGAPAIFADTVARLSHTSGIIARIGDDAFGRCVRNRLKQDGVDVRFVSVDPAGSTACAFVAYTSDGSRSFLFHLADTPAVRARVPVDAPLPTADFFHVMGCSLTAGEGLAAEIRKAAEGFSAQGASLSFDPNFRPELLRSGDFAQLVAPILKGCKVLLPGREELLSLAGKADVPEAAAFIFAETPVEVIALKLGHMGCRILTKNVTLEIPAYPVKAVDPTGAGDCFDAAFLCALAEGEPLAQCARFACAAAALCTERLGPMEGQISRERVMELMESVPATSHDV